ncbi:Crp/Fnr family transcriptional regulator [Parabacteroides provencensis]|uniref:Crp/Fnr family transcriptional regulator n=1 Tax=Parabacteroides provencensis TaxID=1944636 RepID=UPI000C1466FF|nr:Crp/Fnr family transcriptional regulator [Parabacteroides provencensis]
MEKQDLLFFCTMCRDKSAEEIEKIQCTIPHSLKTFKRGEHVAFQGDKVLFLAMLIRGRVKTEIVSNSGLTLPMEEIAAPYPLAAAFLFADDNRFPVDVIAMEECEVLFISKESIEKQIAKCPGFMRGFMAFNANRMQYISERLKIFAQKGIKAKLGYYILSREKKGEFDLGRSVASLASYFGVERPSLSRAISEMVGDGTITFRSGKGTILDFDALEDILL